MSELKVVTQLRETKTKYDTIINGKMVRLKLSPCTCGIHASWVSEEKLIDSLPPHIKTLLGKPGIVFDGPDPEQKIERVMMEFHYEPRWWWRIIGRTQERELRKWIQKSHKKLIKLKDAEDAVSRFQKEIEV